MNKNKRIEFKLTNDEYKRIIDQKNKYNYRTLSDYCRYVLKNYNQNGNEIELKNDNEILNAIDQLRDSFLCNKFLIKNNTNEDILNKFFEIEDNQNKLINLLYAYLKK